MFEIGIGTWFPLDFKKLLEERIGTSHSYFMSYTITTDLETIETFFCYHSTYIHSVII